MNNKGITLVSFMVALALSSIVGLMVIRLTGHQGKAMLVISLLEEREYLLKHYSNMLVEGWNKTRSVTSSFPDNNDIALAVYDRNENEVIKATGSSPDQKPWWILKATARGISSVANVEMGEYHAKGKEKTVKVKIAIVFDPAKHWGKVGKVIATREEWVYLHNVNIPANIDTDCNHKPVSPPIPPKNQHPSRQKASGGSPIVLTPLYPQNAQGALTSFDFNTNIARCSGVPLIRDSHSSRNSNCSTNTPIVGFDNEGDPICSDGFVSLKVGCNRSGEYIRKIDKDGNITCNTRNQSHPQGTFVAIMNPIPATNNCWGRSHRFYNDETSEAPHLFESSWSGFPSGEIPRTRSQLEKPGGFQGLSWDGNLLSCITLDGLERRRYLRTNPPPSRWVFISVERSKGLQGRNNYTRGETGDRGPQASWRGPRGHKGPDGRRGDTGRRIGTQGPSGSCSVSNECRSDSDCTRSICDHYGERETPCCRTDRHGNRVCSTCIETTCLDPGGARTQNGTCTECQCYYD